jgi:iron(III) transport system permease protein
VITVLVLGIVALLLFVMLETQFEDPQSATGYSLRRVIRLYTSSFVYSVLGNTFGFVAVSTGVAFFFALPIALLVQRTTLPGRTLVFPLLLAAVLVPGYINAQAWLLMFHPRIGTMNRWLVDTFESIETAPFNVINIPSMGLINGLDLAALAFIMLAGAFRPMDPALEESAQVHGLRLSARLRFVTLPAAWPGILSALIFVTMLGIASSDVARVIGLSRRIWVFSTAVSGDGVGGTGASSLLWIAVAVAASWWYLRVIRHQHRFAVVTGRNYRVHLISLSRKQIAFAWGFIGVLILFSLVLPLLILLWASLLPYFDMISVEAMGRVTLDNYRAISLDGRFWAAAKNTMLLLAIVPGAAVLSAFVISWVVVRGHTRFTWIVDSLAFLPHGVPSVLFAVAAIHIGLFWMPASFPFYRTMYVLVLVFFIVRISFPTRVLTNALVQVHRELDEAGYVAGLGPLKVLRKILFPLVWGPVMYSWLWVALLTYRERTIAGALQGRGTRTLAQHVNLSGGGLTEGAAMAVFLFVIVTTLVTLYFIWGRRRGAFSM